MIDYGQRISEGLALGIASRVSAVTNELRGLDRLLVNDFTLNSGGEFNSRKEIYLYVEVAGKDLDRKTIDLLKREIVRAVQIGA